MKKKIFSALFATLVIAVQAASAPLHLAAEKGDTKAIVALIDEGADPNAKDDWGRYPLYWARREWSRSCDHSVARRRRRILFSRTTGPAAEIPQSKPSVKPLSRWLTLAPTPT